MTTTLIGSTGFVGTTLLAQTSFDECFHSTDIQNIDGKEYDLVVCAAAPAKKWYANLHPDEDRVVIDNLIDHLKTVKTKRFVLISTVDVFKSPVMVDENTQINLDELQPYGFNRRRLELFVENTFQEHLIVRLPGLVGAGLRKNIIFDFKHHNNLELIESKNVFQFYPMKNLWSDLQICIKNRLKLVHLTAAPVSVQEVAKKAFNLNFENSLNKPLVNYDFRTIHAALWATANSSKTEPGEQERYFQYSKDESLNAIKEYAILTEEHGV